MVKNGKDCNGLRKLNKFRVKTFLSCIVSLTEVSYLVLHLVD